MTRAHDTYDDEEPIIYFDPGEFQALLDKKIKEILVPVRDKAK